MANEIAHKTAQQGEIILYQPDETVRIERLRVGGLCPGMVRLEDDTVWLTTNQMAALFDREESNIRRHVINVFREGELERANKVIKDYLLHGYAFNQRLLQMEQRLDARLDAHTQTEQQRFMQIESTLADHQEKIDFFVRTNQPPVEGIFYDGQIFDA